MAQRQTDGAKKPAVRESNFELLRILAMILIVAGHFGSHSGYEFPQGQLSGNRLWVELFEIGGNISVNVFVLLSGYFRIESKGRKTGKLIQLWLQLIFYSMAIYFSFVAMGRAPLALGEIIRRVLPVSFMQWWFASTYFVLALLSPYLNRLLRPLSRKQYQGLLALVLLCWSVMPTLTGQAFEGNHLLWFMCLYALGGYLRRYGLQIRLSAGKWIALSGACVALTYLSVLVLTGLGARSAYLEKNRFYFYEIQRVPLLMISVLLFVGFSRLRVKPSPVINTIASAMFGVYLIHDHSYVRYFLWLDLFHNMDHGADPTLFLRFLGEVSAVLVVCTLIELARQHLLEKRYMPWVGRVAGAIDRKWNRLFEEETEEGRRGA
ncbi:MAG: acyltransferase [Clostridia bacterium]|nr:acyltransferase [Clostridia bacterium]